MTLATLTSPVIRVQTRKLYTRLILGLNVARKSSNNDLFIGINWPSIVLAYVTEAALGEVT
jgi:hypothetical protein